MKKIISVILEFLIDIGLPTLMLFVCVNNLPGKYQAPAIAGLLMASRLGIKRDIDKVIEKFSSKNNNKAESEKLEQEIKSFLWSIGNQQEKVPSNLSTMLPLVYKKPAYSDDYILLIRKQILKKFWRL